MEVSDISKITKKRYIPRTIKVMTRKDLKDVLRDRYSRIVLEGELGNRLYKEMNGFSSAEVVKDNIFNLVFNRGSLKGLKKELKDYRMVSSDAKETVIELQDSKKGFKKRE